MNSLSFTLSTCFSISVHRRRAWFAVRSVTRAPQSSSHSCRLDALSLPAVAHVDMSGRHCQWPNSPSQAHQMQNCARVRRCISEPQHKHGVPVGAAGALTCVARDSTMRCSMARSSPMPHTPRSTMLGDCTTAPDGFSAPKADHLVLCRRPARQSSLSSLSASR